MEDLKLKSIRLATDEEIEEIAKEQWQDEHMQEYIKKNYNFYMLKDGYFLELQKPNKYSINKTMWYDDETEGPEENESNFILYNLRMRDPSKHVTEYKENLERLKTHGCAIGLYDYNGLYLATFYKFEKRADVCFFSEKKGTFLRYLTEEEQEDYMNILEHDKQAYIERLKKYFKRYGKHVHASGYWVNR